MCLCGVFLTIIDRHLRSREEIPRKSKSREGEEKQQQIPRRRGEAAQQQKQEKLAQEINERRTNCASEMNGEQRREVGERARACVGDGK